jgi:C4-dicarboxylate-specific signal transduction histidine kinase
MLTENPSPQSTEQQAQLKHLLRRIVDETWRASDIVRGLRSYFISGVSTLQKVEVQSLVDECLSRVVKRAELAQVTLDTCYSQQVTHVMVDRVQISTAIGNLLKNAIDVSEAGMRVTVRVSNDKHMLTIGVIDQANLLEDDLVDQVFRPFFSSKKDGLGLGLSVSQSLVENNGGMLRYQARPEKCFEILLPLGENLDA